MQCYVFIIYDKEMLFYKISEATLLISHAYNHASDGVLLLVRDTALYAKVIFENIGTHEVLKGDAFDMCTCQFFIKAARYRSTGKFDAPTMSRSIQIYILIFRQAASK